MHQNEEITLVHLKTGKQFGGAEQYCYYVLMALARAGGRCKAVSSQLPRIRAAQDCFNHIGIAPDRRYFRSFRARVYRRLRLGRLYLRRALHRHAENSGLLIVGHINLLLDVADYARKAGKKYWLLVYGIDIWREWSVAERNAIEAADRVVAISAYTAETVRRALWVPFAVRNFGMGRTGRGTQAPSQRLC